MRLQARLVAPRESGTWVRGFELPIAPFPGLGIRLAPYEIFNVESVVVGDAGCDVTCIGSLEEVSQDVEALLEQLGFEIAPYP